MTPAEVQEQEELAAAGDLALSSQFYGPALDKTGIRPSRFIGTESKMSFLSLSHIRVYKNSPESDFAKISYELQRDEDAPEVPDTMVLYKIENVDAFDVEDKKGTEKKYPILRGIRKLRFRYYQYKEKDLKPHNSWDSTTEDFKNIYPDMIELNVEVAGPSNLSFEGTFKMRPEIPLRALDPSI
jgi:hypothetical protein